MPESRGRQKQNRRPYVPPPARKKRKSSPRWFGVLILGVMGVGVAMIILNYLPGAPLLPGDTSNLWLWLGLGLIALGFVGATQWR